nr:hypothetical protein [Pandoravirus massiliensis]
MWPTRSSRLSSEARNRNAHPWRKLAFVPLFLSLGRRVWVPPPFWFFRSLFACAEAQARPAQIRPLFFLQKKQKKNKKEILTFFIEKNADHVRMSQSARPCPVPQHEEKERVFRTGRHRAVNASKHVLAEFLYKKREGAITIKK